MAWQLGPYAKVLLLLKKMYEWATPIDMLVFAYITKINVIALGNYLNGLVCNNMQLCLN